MGMQEMIIAQRQIDGVTIDFLDHKWNVGDEAYWAGPVHMISWRLFPANIGFVAKFDSNEHCFGRMHFCPAGTSLRSTPSIMGQRAQSIRLKFEPSWFADVAELDESIDDHDVTRFLNIDNAYINHIFQKIGSELLNDFNATETLLKSLCTATAIDITRNISSVDNHPIKPQRNIFNQNDLFKIMQYVQNSIEDEEGRFDFDILARSCNISVSHLRRVFKNTTGKTLYRYVSDVRLARAKSLLEGSDPIKLIAFRLGYRSVSAFSYAFRSASGQTAREFRENSYG